MTKTRTIYCLCPDSNSPCGGVRKIYNFVDLLREMGFEAFVLHAEWGFKCDWFLSDTPIIYMTSPYGSLCGFNEGGEPFSLPHMSEEDLLIIPEIFVLQVVPNLAKWNVKGIIFNQNAFQTFSHTAFPTVPFSAGYDREGILQLYLNERILGVFVVSEHSKAYLDALNLNLSVYSIHNSINKSLFFYQSDKKKQIAYMPRKSFEDCLHIIILLKARGLLSEWSFYPIEGVSEVKVSQILRESALFLSFSEREGFGMPPAEAMACGCVVIGYHGQGGKEYLKRPYGYPIDTGDLIEFALTVEKIALNYETFQGEGKMASEFILQHYSQEQEKRDIKHALEALGVVR
jgi:hypothetical protein